MNTAQHDVERDRKDCDHHHNGKIKRHVQAMRGWSAAQSAYQLQTPEIEMLNSDHHDDGGQHDAGDFAKPAEQESRSDQQCCGIDQHRQRGASAKSSISNAWTDIDAAGNSAHARCRHVAKTKPDQQPVAVAARFVRGGDKLGA